MTGHNTTQNRMTVGRAVISALALLTVFCGMAAAEQLYVNESGWWRDGGAFNASVTPIQEAIDAATPGDSIFVYNGTYYEGGGVSITKEGITLQGEDANTTIIHGRWTAEMVVQVTGDYVNVSSFTVAGSASGGSGIYVNANYCTILDNIASSNYNGIYLFSSSNNNDIAYNWVRKNTVHGVSISGSTCNNISYNNIIENGNYNATSGGWEWQFYIDQYQPVEAKHNYWGSGMNNETIDASIHDDEEGWGEVEFYPFETEPVQCHPTPEEPPALLEADAGDDQTVSPGTMVELDGSGSTGAGTLTYNWTEGGTVLSDQESFGHEFSIGTHTITLTISNGTSTDDDTVVVRVNHPPIADAGEDRVVSPDTYVKLDASGSNDPDGSIASYEWTEDGVLLSTRKSFNKIFGYGVHKVTLTVTDDFGDQDTDCMIVMILLRGDLNHDGIITPADAAIALEIAVGSRPCDDAMLAAADVSGDGSVTSLDALMILQAAARGISVG